MKAIVAVVLLAVVLLVAAKTQLWEGSRYSVEERDKAVLSALSRLNEKSMNVAHLASTGNEFAVGLFMTMNRFKNPLIRKKAIKMAAEVCSRWQKLVAPEPRKQLANVTNPLKVMYWVQMLAMQKKFNTDAKYVDELEAALREKISTLKIKEAFSVAGKNFHEPSTQWTEYGSFCVNLILHNFAHFAGLSDMKVVGKVAMRKMIKKSFRAYRKEYRKLSFKRPANFKLYTQLDGRTQDKFVKDFLPYHDLIYVVTHYVYVFTGYTGNFQKRTARILRKERRFLAKELPYVVKYVQDPDMIGEMVDSLLALGVKQDNKDIQDGVEFILSHQAKDGMWIDYTHPLLADIQAPELKWFHTTMAAMFSLGDERVKNAKCPLPKVLSVMRSSPRIF